MKAGSKHRALGQSVIRVRPRFSVVMITRNEGERLGRLMTSLAEFRERGGEIVIVDTGSTDDTVPMAQGFGCRVFAVGSRFDSRLTQKQAARINRTFVRKKENPLVKPGIRLFHFGRAREYASSLAKNNFQLVVDGSDTVDALGIDALNARIARRTPALPFEIRVWDQSGWHVARHNCFYDRRALAWEGRAHNYLRPRDPKALTLPSAPVPRNELLVSHHTNLEKVRDYQLAGVALELLASPSSSLWTYYLARALAASSRPQSALPLALRLDQDPTPPEFRAAGLCIAAACLHRLGGSPDDVESYLFRAARRAPHKRDPLIRLSQVRLAQGDFQGAASFASAALAVPPQVSLTEPEGHHSVTTHEILYWSLFWLGRRKEAREHLRICLAIDPSSTTYQAHARLMGEP